MLAKSYLNITKIERDFANQKFQIKISKNMFSDTYTQRHKKSYLKVKKIEGDFANKKKSDKNFKNMFCDAYTQGTKPHYAIFRQTIT